MMPSGHRTLLAALAVCAACATPLRRPEALVVPQPASEPTGVVAPSPRGVVAKLDPRTPGLFGRVVEVPGGLAFVIHSPSPDAMRAGEERVEVRGPLSLLEAEVDLESVPEVRHLVGLEVDLYEGSTRLCRAELGPLIVAGHVEWQSFDDGVLGFDVVAGARPPTDEDRARAALGFAPRWLAARLDDDACATAEWGRLASLPPPHFAVELGKPEPSEPLARLERAEVWGSHQAAFEQHEQLAFENWGVTPTGGRFSDDASARTEARSFRFGGRDHVLVRVEAGEPCSFHASARGLFRAGPRGLEQVLIDDGFVFDGVLVDLDLDGELELIQPNVVESLGGEGWWWTNTQPGRHSCGC